MKPQLKPQFTIHIQPLAACKPAAGTPCNGCGVCCLSEPCPLGMLLSGRRTGACEALRWEASLCQYRCGAVSDAAAVLRQRLSRRPALAGAGWRALARPAGAALDCRRPGLR